jgi:hypothetical protein
MQAAPDAPLLTLPDPEPAAVALTIMVVTLGGTVQLELPDVTNSAMLKADPVLVIVRGLVPVIKMPAPAMSLFEIVVGLVPVNAIPLPAANVLVGTETQLVRLPLLSKQAPWFRRLARIGSSARVSPGRASTARPLTSLILSQSSLSIAMTSVKV